jgi:NAD(P)-dependent dehydrogenase (short-subunit alcohol dehydrogenase family)
MLRAMAKGKARPLEGQVAVVTGGGKGIGRAVALALAARGVKVLVTGREEKALGEVVGEIAYGGGQARHLAGDVRDAMCSQAAVARALEVFGGLDIVVANAGQSGLVRMGGELARAESILQTNLTGTYYTFDAALRAMKGPGRLIAMSSVLGKFGVPGYAAYCASKAGILGLVRAVALEVGARGITCNAITPGSVDTSMTEDGIRDVAASRGISPEEAKKNALAELPLARFVEPEEVAELVVFLCTSAADAITGQAISMSGMSGSATALGG